MTVSHSTAHSLMLIMTVSLRKDIRDVSGPRPDRLLNLTSLPPQMCQLWKQVGIPLLSPPRCSDHILQMEVLLVTSCYMHAFLALLSYHSPFHFNPMYVPRFLSVVYPLHRSGLCRTRIHKLDIPSGPRDLVLVRNVGYRSLQRVHAFQSTNINARIITLAKFHCILFTV